MDGYFTDQVEVGSNRQMAYVARLSTFDKDSALSIPNAWTASTPEHPFWLWLLKNVMLAAVARDKNAEDTTGPTVLFNSIQEYKRAYPKHNNITILDDNLIYPYSWNTTPADIARVCAATSPAFDSVKCKQDLAHLNSFMIAYWTHTRDDYRSPVLDTI
jgi:hypothetical protein